MSLQHDILQIGRLQDSDVGRMEEHVITGMTEHDWDHKIRNGTVPVCLVKEIEYQ